MAGGVIFGRGGSNQSLAYQPIARVVSPDFTNQAYPPLRGDIQGWNPPAAPNVAAAFSADFINGAASLPSQMTLSRASSATYLDSSGTLQTASSNVARFEYDGYGSPKGLLIEEQRTNVSWPTNLNDAAWGVLGSTTKGTGATAPDGATSCRLIEDSLSGDKGLNRGAGSPNAGTPWSISVYAKPIWPGIGSKRWLVLGGDSSGGLAACFDINTGQVTATQGTGVTASIKYVGNGWWKCMAVSPSTTGATFTVGPSNAAVPTSWQARGSAAYTGDGVSGLDVQFSQVENALGCTSNIITVSGNVTRSADIISSTDATWLGYKGWVIETSDMPDLSAATLLGINTAIGLGYSSTSLVTTADGGTQNATSVYPPVISRAGLAWDSTPRVSISGNGNAVTTAGNTPVTPTTLYFGNTNNGASGYLNGYLRMFGGYATLADADLPSVTVQGAIFSPPVANVGAASGVGTATGIGAATAAGDGLAAGTGTATAVGASTAASPGSAAGTGAATAVGRATAASPGSASGAGTATATGVAIAAAIGSAAGSGAASGVGASTAASVGSASGTGTATGVGAATAASVGASAGAGAATGVGRATAASVGSAAGTGTATAVGVQIAAGVGSAAGSGAATAIGASTAAGVGSASGTGTAAATAGLTGAATGTGVASGVGASTAAATAAATGSGAATAVGMATAASPGSITGSGTATGVGASIAAAVGSAAGSGSATAVDASTAAAIGSAAGSGAATAVGRSTAAAVGSSIGSGTATGVGAAGTIASASGAGTATGVGASTAAAVGSAAGSGTATAVGTGIIAAVGSAAGSGTATAVGTGTATADGIGAAAGAATVLGVGGSIARAVGSAAGAGHANGVSSSIIGVTTTSVFRSTRRVIVPRADRDTTAPSRIRKVA